MLCFFAMPVLQLSFTAFGRPYEARPVRNALQSSKSPQMVTDWLADLGSAGDALSGVGQTGIS